jgi:hypothetical protein
VDIILFLYYFVFECRASHLLGRCSTTWAFPLAFLHPLASRQNLFCAFLQFCWREDISNNERDRTFLLVWSKDFYTERFLALLPRTCVLQPELVHLYQTSSLLSGHLPMVTSVTLRLFINSSTVDTSNTFEFRVSYLSLFFMYVLGIFKIGSLELFAQNWLLMVNLLIFAFWAPGNTGVSHWHPATLYF